MEEWRQIPGNPNYEASNLGRIRSVDRYVTTRAGVKKFMRGRVLRPGRHSDAHPYPYVNVYGKGKSNVGVHVLVALTFIGPRPEGQYVCHKNGNPADCRAENLYYGTPTENQADRRLHGTDATGEKHPGAKLTQWQAGLVRLMRFNGIRQRDIAKRFGITQPQVSHIENGKHWNA
jgi:hypothetical protein